ncbi:MAG: endonuclease MutS2 [Sumerlaeia bacterium]
MDQHSRAVLEVDDLLSLISRSAACSLGQDFVQCLQPLTSVAEIEARLALVEEQTVLLNRNTPVPLGGLEDVCDLLQSAQLEGSSLDREDWPRLVRWFSVVERIKLFLASQEKDTSPRLRHFLEPLGEYGEFTVEFRRTFDDNGLIKDNATSTLSSIRSRLRGAEATIRKTVQRLLREWGEAGALQEDFATTRGERNVLPVKAGARGKIKGILHGSSTSGETLYIEPLELLEPANELELLREQELREIHRILLALTAKLRPLLPQLAEDLELLRMLDGLNAVARHGWSRGWNIPLYGEGGSLRLFHAHHPLLQEKLKKKSVPITVSLDLQDRAVIISGPNAGGKTTAMKSLGLACFLLLCGSPIPASADSRLPFFQGIFADIGDQQDLQEGLSTYSGHIRRMRQIIDGASSRSLILLDELGTGTDPDEGGALAQSLLEFLLDRASLTIATSHLAALKIWAEDSPGARNASFRLDPSTHQPTFTVTLDLPGASEALTIAENHGMPELILQRARLLVGEQKLAMGELLNRIEGLEKSLAQSAREAAARAQSLEAQERIAAQRAQELREEKRLLKSTFLLEKRDAVEKLREEIERSIANLPSEEFQLSQRRESLNHLRNRLRGEQVAVHQERTSLARQQDSGPAPRSGELAPGMKVYVKPLSAWGEVKELLRDGKKATVLVGSVETTMLLNDLSRKETPPLVSALAKPAPPTPERRPGTKKTKPSKRLKEAMKVEATPPSPEVYRPRQETTTTPATRQRATRENVKTELDLHGFRVEEAVNELDRYLDRALLANYSEVRIIHGLGEGKLYRAVHEYLRKNPSIKHYRFGLDVEGGGGVTVVKL